MMRLSVFLLVLTAAGVVFADTWAVLLAGSNGFWNYRHQADVCHAYQILHRNGVPDDHIITMFYDDVANDPSNPFPGKIFNKPNGTDVYAGCKKDYTGNDVSIANFVAVLTGDSAAVKGGSGRVLKSTANDTVFINFVDHGGVGIICFPTGELLHANDLNSTLTKMYQQKMYKELVFYMEACESGSMFEDILASNINIYVTTAANADESSWGTYCPPQDSVGGKEIGSCLGDLYSVNWMENTDSLNGTSETLQQQFEIVKNLTTQSHVMQYGQLSISSEPISHFLAKSGARMHSTCGKRPTHVDMMTIDSRDIKLHTLYYQYLRAVNAADRHAKWDAVNKEISHRNRVDEVFRSLATKLAGPKNLELLTMKMTPTQWDCIKRVNHAVGAICGLWSDYATKYTRLTVNICESGFQVEDVVKHLSASCP